MSDRVPGPDHAATTTPNRIIHDPKVRKYAYLGVVSIVAALVVLGYVTEEQIAEWAAVTISILAIVSNLLATFNTPKEKP